MKVLQFPLARITIGFILGILLCFYTTPSFNLVLAITACTFIGFIVVYFRWSTTSYFGLLTFIVAISLGTITQIAHTDSYQPNNYIHNHSSFEQSQNISIVIGEQLKKTNFNDRYYATITQIGNKSNSGKIILNLPKDSTNHIFETGTCLLIKGKLIRNNKPYNPNQFDYGAYLQQKQIYAQLYATNESIAIGNMVQKDIWYYISRLRHTIIQNLEKNKFNKKELGVALALVMGQRQDISPELIQEYQYAGAVHILSVSGLHVGFILLFLNLLLKPIPNTKKGAIIKLVISISCLWVFALIAGLSPSVVRSVTMFSFVAVGYHLRRTLNIYHSILVSMLLILLFQPSFLFDVGFQLSYCALFFIIWLQPLLASIWKPKKWLSKYIWNALTVSFAAQLGTMPLSIYYFHQFPGLFFITNIIIIPLVCFIMVLGVVVLFLAAFNYIPILLAKPLEWGIYYLNTIISTIASFEKFVFHNIPFHFYLLISCYLLIISSIVYLKKPRFTSLLIVLLSIITIQISYMTIKYNIRQEKEWIVLHVKRQTQIVERHGENIVLYQREKDSALSKNNILNGYLVANFSTIKQRQNLKNLLYCNGTKILIVDSSGVYPTTSKPDIVLLTQTPKINMDRMLIALQPKLVIADASNYRTIQNNWKESCLQQKIPFHATAEKGFFKLN